jgi:hypothetical protein
MQGAKAKAVIPGDVAASTTEIMNYGAQRTQLIQPAVRGEVNAPSP